MKKIVSLIICAILSIGAVMAQALTDKQVVEYIQSASAEGKSQNQIATELAARGVTREQAARIQKQYGYQQTDDQEAKAITKNRMRYATEDQEAVAEQQDDMAGNMQSNKGKKFENRYNKPQTTDRKLGQFDGFNKEPRSFSERGFEEDVVFYDENTILYQDEEYRKVETKPIFGRNIFNTRNLTFSPNQNIATPANHKLGPGDEVIIDIWGANQTSISQTISPDGYINIDNLGLIYLNNMTVAEAEKYLRKRLAAIYSSVDEQSSASQIKLTLGQIRTIQVHVMGEVVNPGTFSLSAFSTAFYALYHAGGVSELGSLRQISVLRKGKEVAKVDVYDFILSGNSAGDISLQDGDMIVVPTYHSLVEVTGSVKRPMFYELTDGESVNTLINYAGNFTGDAYRKSVTVTRKNGREYQIHTVDEENYPTFTLVDGDQIEVGQMLDRFENRLKIRGAVYRAGVYQLNDKINSVKTLIEKAEGIMDDAFLARAVLQRERPDLTLEIIPIDLSGILNGTVADIALQKNDELYIPSIHDLKDIGTIEVMGEVARPGTFPYSENATIEDMIILAGGLLESASAIRVDISRRVIDPHNTEAKENIGEHFTFALKNGFMVDGQKDFVLKPYDQIQVRKNPAYQKPSQITVSGEVLYDGVYTLTKKTERLSDIIAKAGGVTPFAYVKGARLIRKINDDEFQRAKNVYSLAKRSEKDSIDMNSLNLTQKYSVGIDLQKALANPGSDADVVLRADDELIVPELNNTVRISGCVMYPNTVSFADNKTMKYYIEQSGGFAQNAKRAKCYVVYMNGQIRRGRLNKFDLIEPGCEVIVPMKEKNTEAFKNILSVATTSASLATMIASITNLVK